MENEEKLTIAPLTDPAEEAEDVSRAPGAVELAGVDIDQEVINSTSRMTPAYLKMLERKQQEMEEEAAREAARSLPASGTEDQRRRKELETQIAHQEQLIAANKRALFGKKRKIRKSAEEKLAQLNEQLKNL